MHAHQRGRVTVDLALDQRQVIAAAQHATVEMKPELAVFRRERRLCDFLDHLAYRERRVLEMRYGLYGEHPRTLDEVGREFNVTRERIRQIESQSLRKLQAIAKAQSRLSLHGIA